MLGDAIMVAPILLEGTNTTQAYFPAGRWYDLYNHSSIDTSNAAQHLPVVVGLLPHATVLYSEYAKHPVPGLSRDMRTPIVSGLSNRQCRFDDIIERLMPLHSTLPDHDLTEMRLPLA